MPPTTAGCRSIRWSMLVLLFAACQQRDEVDPLPLLLCASPTEDLSRREILELNARCTEAIEQQLTEQDARDDSLTLLIARQSEHIERLEMLLEKHEMRIEDLEEMQERLDALPRVVNWPESLQVPTQYATVQDAMDALSWVIFGPNGRATIQIAPGTYTLGETLYIGHFQGGQIEIIGEPSAPSSVVLSFTSYDGISVLPGQRLGYIDGVTVRGSGAGSGVGLAVPGDGYLTAGAGVIAERWGRAGFAAENNGVIWARESTARNNPGVGYLTDNGGVLRAGGSHATQNGVFGYQAANGSFLEADSSVSSSNAIGYLAVNGSSMWVAHARAEQNREDGFYADFASTMDATFSSATQNHRVGYHATNSSNLVVRETVSSGNWREGYRALGASSLDMTGAVASGNGTHGLYLWGSSHAAALDVTFTDNALAGVVAGPTSTVTLQGVSAVEGNAGGGVLTHGNGYVTARSATIRDNGAVGIEASEGSYADVTRAQVSGHVDDYLPATTSQVTGPAWGVLYEEAGP